eukprot:gnl/MRDRNA2_/MRDRNA2_72379_c0_seq1.p1 gnl/MRDRNA2_/MRDRNA2_72379_c0~~gnl/MRDRNA2_/MRDRNA2_72379_c0_seq1.p1  ORF type:complete len:164 (+),score=45.77 gnl/MRDRNA2_/MRDRNA2_72379_c0_seq1:87-578(+)
MVSAPDTTEEARSFEKEEEDSEDELWSRNQRRSLKESSVARLDSKDDDSRPGTANNQKLFWPAPRGEPRREGYKAQEQARLEAKAEGQAQSTSDLQCFLAMHNLSSSWENAFAAQGVTEFHQLLEASTSELDSLIVSSNMEAMDEIFLREALNAVRPEEVAPE